MGKNGRKNQSNLLQSSIISELQNLNSTKTDKMQNELFIRLIQQENQKFLTEKKKLSVSNRKFQILTRLPKKDVPKENENSEMHLWHA